MAHCITLILLSPLKRGLILYGPPGMNHIPRYNILLTPCREWKNHYYQGHHERVFGTGLLPHVRQIS
jgi:hypothetical protein